MAQRGGEGPRRWPENGIAPRPSTLRWAAYRLVVRLPHLVLACGYDADHGSSLDLGMSAHRGVHQEERRPADRAIIEQSNCTPNLPATEPDSGRPLTVKERMKKTQAGKPKPSKFTKSNYRRVSDGVEVRRSTFDLPEELLHRWAIYVAQNRTTKVAHLRELLEKALSPDKPALPK